MTIGVSPPRLEAGDKATGRARYVDDIRLPGMLHAALVTSRRFTRTRTRRSFAIVWTLHAPFQV